MIKTDILKNRDINVRYGRVFSSDMLFNYIKNNIYAVTKTVKTRDIEKLHFAFVSGLDIVITNDKISSEEFERFMKEYVQGKPVIELDGDYINMNTVTIVNPHYAEVDKEVTRYYTMEKDPKEVFYDEDNQEFYYIEGGKDEK